MTHQTRTVWMCALAIASAILANATAARAQIDPTFQWLYGFPGQGAYEAFNDFTRTTDGGFIAVGTNSIGTNAVYVVRTDECGVVQWAAWYDVSPVGSDEGRKVVRGVDGGYVIVGTTQDLGGCFPTGTDAFAMKISDNGTVLWTKIYNGMYYDEANDIAAYGAGYVIAGSTSTFGAGESDAFLLRVGTTGTPISGRTYGGARGDAFKAVSVAANGDIVAAGTTLSYTAGFPAQIYVARVAADLSLQWANHYGGAATNDLANDVLVLTNGSIAVAGSSDTRGPEDPYVLRLGSTGICACDAVYFTDTNSFGTLTELAETSRGELAVTGYYFNEPHGFGRYDVLLLRLDSGCKNLWARQYGGVWRDQGQAIEVLPAADVFSSETYVIAGSTNTWSNGSFDDGYLIRTDRDGITGCHVMKTALSSKSPGFCAQSAPTAVSAFALVCAVTVYPTYDDTATELCRDCGPEFGPINGRDDQELSRAEPAEVGAMLRASGTVLRTSGR